MKNVIKIAELLSTQVRSRSNADILREELNSLISDNPVLDFSDVTFISRSFADELLRIMEELHDKNITLENQTIPVKTMLEIVRANRQKSRVIPHDTEDIQVFNDMKSLSDFLATI